ncbi:MAG: alpha-galactosidase [Clostridia bacterium]|nr:alpha-galactosidase [Clostridia bacterium]
MTIYSRFEIGDMVIQYMPDDRQHMGMRIVPLADENRINGGKKFAVENLVQLHARGDKLPNGYGNGHTLATSASTDGMLFQRHEKQGDTIVTVLADENGRTVYHRVTARAGAKAVRVSAVFENRSDKDVTLDLLSSLNIGGITPFADGDAHGDLILHRARSMWSAEGRLQSESIENAMLERSWTGHALRICKFGQIGSMPVRDWFPFAAIEDRRNDVTWAMQLACPSSWQMEIRRKDDCLSMMASLPDEDYGHWAKTVRPGEKFETPEAYLTVGRGGVDVVSQRLLTLHRENMTRGDAELPVLFNEYCTTWGNPTHENLKRITECLRGRGIDFLVIDAGWYGTPEQGWSNCGGDWLPNETIFPYGLKGTADMIREAGMIPGLWFEAETCASQSAIRKREEYLLTRYGNVIDTDNRCFLDMRKEETHAYLDERVAGLLRKCGFGYIKIDYNDTIGVGCDDPDSPGEGLRQNMQGTLRFFRHLREAVPELYIENCASGGHRLEPSLMGVSDMASFSDAHECAEIPIIAAQLHRLILPAQSQIWAVLRAEDSLRRVNYSLINTFLGVMCLSGDVCGLSDAQWDKVNEGITFYREVSAIIRDGVSVFHGDVSESWRHPEGWQAVVRTAGDEILAVIHTFGGEHPDEIRVPAEADRILRVMCSEDNRVTLDGEWLRVQLKAPFEAVAVHLKQEKQ